MADLLIDFSAITVPTPEPYDNNRAERQRENMAYVVNQILQQMQQNGIILEIPETVGVQPAGSMQGIEDALRDLVMTGYSIQIGPLKFAVHGQVGLASIEEG
jgi:hypothetical protein